MNRTNDKQDQVQLEQMLVEIKVIYAEEIRQYDVCDKMNEEIRYYLEQGDVGKPEIAERILQSNEQKMQEIVRHIVDDYPKREKLVYLL